MTRKMIYVALFLYFSFVLLPKFCYQGTGDFWLQTILSERAFDPRWETPAPSKEELKEINAILSRPFTFVGGGMQSFVFLSEDKKSVIKFFKHRFSLLKKGRFRTHTPFLDSIFESYHIAHQQFPKETGVYYAHLNRTVGRHPPITLIDKMGITHRFDLGGTEFVLQKRADLICPTLCKQMEAKDIDGAMETISSLVSTLKSIYSHGIMNMDRAFRRNVGMTEGRAILIDAGSLCADPMVLDPQEARRDIIEKGINLEKWLMKHYPQLYDHYCDRIQMEFGGSSDT